MLPLSNHPRLPTAPASWTQSKRFARQVIHRNTRSLRTTSTSKRKGGEAGFGVPPLGDGRLSDFGTSELGCDNCLGFGCSGQRPFIEIIGGNYLSVQRVNRRWRVNGKGCIQEDTCRKHNKDEEKWTPFSGPRNAEIKLGFQVLLGLCFIAA